MAVGGMGESHIHGTYVVISDWESEREGEGDEKRCRISICCANITKAHAYMGYPLSARVAPKIAAKTRQESIAMDVNSDHV